MKRILPYHSLLLFIIYGTFSVQSQEILTGIEVNRLIKNSYLQAPGVKKSVGGSLELPFFDDFSHPGVYPDPAKWSDRYAFINNDYPVNPVSQGVATLDAIDHSGALYEHASTWPFAADKLTSVSLNLDYLPGDSLYLSFYYQPQGKGDSPQVHDSLKLEFYSPLTESWQRIWAVPGESVHEFRLVMVPLDNPMYLQDGFRFRFTNIASIANNPGNPGAMGNGDHWHIDYVYLDLNRSFADTVFRDIAFVKPLKTLLRNYESMPWDQFLAGRLIEMGSMVPLAYRNNDNAAGSAGRQLSIHNVYENRSVYTLSGGTVSIGPGELQLYNPDLSYSFSAEVVDSALFRIKAWLVTGASDYKRNDTLVFHQKFANYFAYDDGTSENGYGLFGEGTANASLAYRFRAYKADSLRAIQIYFNQSLNNASRSYFKLAVWDDNNGKPGNLVYSQDGARPEYEDELNKFHTFHLDSPVYVSQDFYVGLIQTAPDFLNIGFDINTNNGSRIFYNIYGNWVNSSFEGSLMIRPVVGTPLSSAPSREPIKNANLKVYPNPAVNVLYIDLEPEIEPGSVTYSLFNRMGQLVYQGSGHITSIDTSSLPPGIYFLRTESKNMEFETRKILISN